MADETSSSAIPLAGSGGKSGKGKLKQFIKKNKTLSAVLGAGLVYFGYKELTKQPSAAGEEVATVSGGEGEVSGAPLSPREISHEGVDEEIGAVREEIGAVKEEIRQSEEGPEAVETVPNDSGSESPLPGENGNAPNPVESFAVEPAAGISIHGKTFSGATSSRIGGSGETGGKKYQEYVISFPGKNERWQYFPATGNWRVAPASGNVTASDKGSGGKSPAPATKTASKTSAAAKASEAKKAAAKAVAKANAEKTAANAAAATRAAIAAGAATNSGGGVPQNNAQHPQAVNTGNPCVKGGIGGHTPPTGYHLFCQGGWIWRAPNS